MKYTKMFFNILRSSPIILDFTLLTLYSLTNDIKYLKLLVIKYGLFIVNKLLKKLSKIIFTKFGKKYNGGYYLPLLGRGDRPKGAINCGLFNNCSKKLSKSYGFPSGHAQFAGTLYVMTNFILTNTVHKLVNLLFTVFIASARVYENCHTIEQVIFGYGLGIIFTKYSIKKFV